LRPHSCYLSEMDASTTISIIALGVSALSLGASTILTLRQVRLLRGSNRLPIILDLLAEFRKATFYDRYRYVVDKLPSDHQPDVGISGLPEYARAAVLDVAYFYQTFSLLENLGISRERKALPNLNDRILEVWRAIEPFVVAERQRSLGADQSMLMALEAHARQLEEGNSRPNSPRFPISITRWTSPRPPH
jgi:hypothetical protein